MIKFTDREKETILCALKAYSMYQNPEQRENKASDKEIDSLIKRLQETK